MSASADRNTLEQIAPPILESLARSFAELIRALPPSVSTAAELARALDLERSLAWKIWRVAQGEDSLPSPRHIPGRHGVELFLKSASKHVPSDLVTGARDAYTEFENLIRIHAGSRANLDTLLSRFTSDGNDHLELAIRRDGYRARSHFAGIQVSTYYLASIFYPSGTGYGPNIARVPVYQRLRRTRPSSCWTLHVTRLLSGGKEDSSEEYKVGPLGSRGSELQSMKDGGILIPSFSSYPEPPLNWAETRPGLFEGELQPGPIGESGAMDCAFGERVWNVPLDDTPDHSIIAALVIPAEQFCVDLIIHPALWDGKPPQIAVKPHIVGGDYRFEPRLCVPVPETPIDLGPSHLAPPFPHLARHRQLMQYVFEQLELDAGQFHTYRVAFRYPPTPMVMRLSFMKPD